MFRTRYFHVLLQKDYGSKLEFLAQMNNLTFASEFPNSYFGTSAPRVLSRELSYNFIFMEKSVMLIRFKFEFNLVRQSNLQFKRVK